MAAEPGPSLGAAAACGSAPAGARASSCKGAQVLEHLLCWLHVVGRQGHVAQPGAAKVPSGEECVLQWSSEVVPTPRVRNCSDKFGQQSDLRVPQHGPLPETAERRGKARRRGVECLANVLDGMRELGYGQEWPGEHFGDSSGPPPADSGMCVPGTPQHPARAGQYIRGGVRAGGKRRHWWFSLGILDHAAGFRSHGPREAARPQVPCRRWSRGATLATMEAVLWPSHWQYVRAVVQQEQERVRASKQVAVPCEGTGIVSRPNVRCAMRRQPPTT